MILEAGVPILMFAGAEDLICNYRGIERICEGLIWDGKKGMGVSLISLFPFIHMREWE
jgi:carboxypeptidase D